MDHAHTSAPHEFLDAIDEEAVGGYFQAGWFEHGAELAGLFKIEQQLAGAGAFAKEAEQLGEERGVG